MIYGNGTSEYAIIYNYGLVFYFMVVTSVYRSKLFLLYFMLIVACINLHEISVITF